MPAGQDMQHWSERDLPSEPPSLSVVLLGIFTISQERGCACVRTRIHAQVIQPISQDRLPDPISTPSGTLLVSASLYMDRRKCAKQSAQYNVRRTNMLMAELSLCHVNLTESNRRTVWSYKIAGTAAQCGTVKPSAVASVTEMAHPSTGVGAGRPFALRRRDGAAIGLMDFLGLPQ
jgi:hypothetical protein